MCYNSDRTNQCDFFIWDEDQEDEKKRRLNKVLPSSNSPPKTPSSSKRARSDELENHRQSNSYNDDDNERQQERGSPSRKPVKLARFSTPDPVSNNNTTDGSELLLTPSLATELLGENNPRLLDHKLLIGELLHLLSQLICLARRN